jgi:hypothetical protein
MQKVEIQLLLVKFLMQKDGIQLLLEIILTPSVFRRLLLVIILMQKDMILQLLEKLLTQKVIL